MLDINFSSLWLDIAEYFKDNSMRIATSVFALLVVVSIYRRRRELRTPRLQGPRSENFIFGNTKKIFPSANLSEVYRDWERVYGPVYEMPTGIGSSHIVLTDPKALTHIYSKDTVTYCRLAVTSALSRKMFGDVVSILEGETHKRLRRGLSSPLSASAIRNFTPVCLDSAYKLKEAWDSCSPSSGQLLNNNVIIDVAKWMNSVTLDTIGKAIISHDFGTLRGHTSLMMAAFDSIHTIKPSPFIRLIYFLLPILYSLFNVTLMSVREEKLAQTVAHLNGLIANRMNILRTVPEDTEFDASILGILLKSENANSNSRLSFAEIMTQNFLFMAAYETTAITLTWSLIELARRPEIQENLRAELSECLTEGERPTFDQLTKDLKYLDAFITEILRLHAPEMQSIRVAAEDDVVPLTNPIRTASGAMIDSLFLKKGTIIRIPLGGYNMSETLWGPGASMFDPGRWLDAEDRRKRRNPEIAGYRGLLTFSAGPRMCPGRDLAVLEVKAVLSVLVRYFIFELPNGPSTELGWHFTRPKMAGKDGTKMPLLVRRST